MPFTPAHVAAVLPLLGARRPRWVVPSALVVGSMVPDVLYFVPISSDRSFSHSFEGVVTIDLVLGLVFLGLWWLVASPALRDLVPDRVRVRVPVTTPPAGRTWLLSVPGVVVGALTHVAWDAFTHANGWAVTRLPALTADTVAGLPAYKLAQYASGVVGTTLVLAYGLRVLAGRAAAHPATRLATTPERASAWLLLGAAPVATALASAVPVAVVGTQTEMVLYVAVVRGVSGLGLAAAGVAAWWHLWVAGRRRG